MSMAFDYENEGTEYGPQTRASTAQQATRKPQAALPRSTGGRTGASA